MYFLKKFTSFGKNANVEGAAGVNSTPCGSQCASETGMDKENRGISDGDGVTGGDDEKRISSASSLSIPDCFFDEVPETASSDNSEATSSEDTDSQEEGTTSETFRKNVETEKSIGSFSTDESPQKSSETADEVASRAEDSIERAGIKNEGDEIGEECTVLEGSKTESFRICQSEAKSDCGESTAEEDSRERGENILNSSENCEVLSGEAKNNQIPNDIDGEGEAVTMAPFLDTNTLFQPVIDDDFDFYDYFDNFDYEDGGDENFEEKELRNILKDLGDSNEAEARLAARRQARVEAREIRLRELERQQKEQEENADRAFDMSYVGDTILRTGRITPSGTSLNARDRSMATSNSYHSSRRSSEDSIEEGLTLRDIRHELKEAEEKFKKAMIANAQLDNEKSAFAYQVELLKDRFEDLEETHAQLTREHRDKCREHEQLKRAAVKLKEDLEYYKTNLLERDGLIAEYGLVIVDADGDSEEKPRRTLVSAQSAELLQQAGSGSLDVRLKKFSEERNELLDEIRHLKLELEEERSKRIPDNKAGCGSLTNGPLDEETSKILSDYKFKLQKAEQDVSTLQANVARLESQVIRYKTAAESSEKAEDELKIEKRKLQRENRESIARIEELETENSHLQRRMDKLKNAKSTLLKEL